MTPLWLALAAAQAAPAVSAPASQPFSILYQPCPASRANGDVVVCAGSDPNRLPLPDEAPPVAGYVKPDSGDYHDNQVGPAPCAAMQSGCQVGFGPPIMPLLAGGAKLVGNALKDRREARARRRDGDRRVAITLDAPPPAGHVEP